MDRFLGCLGRRGDGVKKSELRMRIDHLPTKLLGTYLYLKEELRQFSAGSESVPRLSRHRKHTFANIRPSRTDALESRLLKSNIMFVD